jgi:aminoglycoside/choline kinase family phosphotransferase
MIPTPKELLVAWHASWKQDLEANLAKQAELKVEGERLAEIVQTCEKAFVLLFPEPNESQPE